MKTKVVLRHNSVHSSHWDYMVYIYSCSKNAWVPVQYFKHNQRKKAIQYAKDISTISPETLESVIWESK